ncbi:MAG: MoxR family ATPase [Oligoflexia bacterium]|nr:MoxR family ATPase [Oligoflexia bacterium]MBF0366852.1 MoxR family ATPase [Oligoflexia bacterium]
MSLSVQQVTEMVNREFPIMAQVMEEISKVVVGQRLMVERLLIGMLGDGHVLVEGVPGLAKTTAVKALAQVIDAKFSRIQFTPDLLPADLLGTQIYSPKDGAFSVKKGPVFANIVLADEINRAPAKVQSALLEAMQEKQVTIGEQTFILPAPFLVLATQNPIEQEGTYPLPEAQVDRFMLKVKISYPSKEEEMQITKRMSAGAALAPVNKLLTPEKIMELRKVVEQIFVDEKLYAYVTDLVFATRNPELFGLKDLRPLIEYGASPRASINLIKVAKAYAFLQGRGYVTPQDIKSIAPDVLRHRVIISYEAEAQDLTSDDLLKKVFDKVDVP